MVYTTLDNMKLECIEMLYGTYQVGLLVYVSK